MPRIDKLSYWSSHYQKKRLTLFLIDTLILDGSVKANIIYGFMQENSSVTHLRQLEEYYSMYVSYLENSTA